MRKKTPLSRGDFRSTPCHKTGRWFGKSRKLILGGEVSWTKGDDSPDGCAQNFEARARFDLRAT